ncbi:DNA-binding transcriptional LysR family regulator [Paraburkholderia sp. BL25I1N1]|nr:DNA-binding transcriptional LysR family regulator [Paraburkholderia sp. BL25I1N1]
MTPSGVSKAVARLEKRIGAQLIARTTRSFQLTEAGATFHTRCKDILDQLAQAERDAASGKSNPRQQIRISTPVGFGRLRVVPLIAEYCERYRSVDVAVRLEDRLADLDREHVDLAIRIGERVEPGLVGIRVSSAAFVCCGSPEYLASAGTPSHPDELRRHRSVDFAGAAGTDTFEWKFVLDGVVEQAAQITPRPTITVDDCDALVAAAEAGAGLIMVHRYLAEKSMGAGRLVPVLAEYMAPPAPIWVVSTAASQASKPTRAMIDFLKLRLHSD